MKDDARLVYLDYASTTPISTVVLEAMLPYFSEDYYNPSALYLSAKKVREDLEKARMTIADILQTRPVEIVFTAGSTEANNMVIHGVMKAYPDKRLLCSAIEHDSVLETVKQYNHTIVPVSAQGIVQLESLKASITDDTVLISCMMANNETGVVQPVHDIVKIVQAVRSDRNRRGVATPLYVHTDAAQAFNYEKVLPHQLGVDFAVISGSKIYGPKQSAVLFVKQGIRLLPTLYGGGQENGLRSGTENVPYCIGLARAITETAHLRDAEHRRLKELQDFAITKLHDVCGAEVNGSIQMRLPNNINVYIPGIDNERLVMQLDERGILAAAGSACHASAEESSHVLRAMGYTDERAKSSVRFTMGRSTTKQDIDELIVALEELLQG